MAFQGLQKNRPARRLTVKSILKLLVKYDLLESDEAKIIFERSKRNKKHPFEVLTEGKNMLSLKRAGFKSAEDFSAWFANKIGFKYSKIDVLKLDLETVVNIIPYKFACRVNIVPIEVHEDYVTFLTCDPLETSWADNIQKLLKKEIRIQFAQPKEIKSLLEEIYIVQKALRDFDREELKEQFPDHKKLLREGKIKELDEIIEFSKQKKWDNSDSAVVRIVDWIFNYAQTERASDIHLEPKRGLGQIRFRIDGKLKVVYRMNPEAMTAVITRLKIMAEMKLDEKRRPQDGRIKRFLEQNNTIELRVSTICTPHGEKMVLRVFDQKLTGQSLDIINFSKEDKERWLSFINNKQGLVLVTGPTGSGKTTTLYSSMNLISNEDVNVCTIEDPVEVFVDSFNQVEVKESIGLTFPNAVRSFLRQDPDIIMVGEIRDYETGDVAVQASLTGHLVFSTLHTNGALASIQRLIDLKIPVFLLNSSLKAVLSQRLVRKLCPYCKKKVEVSDAKWNFLKGDLEVQKPEFSYEACGCDECKQTGYHGRICIYELVEFDDKIKSVIHQDIGLVELQEKTKGSFVTFREKCIERLRLGDTSIEELLEIVY